jgi:hypothetical protein
MCIILSPQFSQQEMVLLGASDVHYLVVDSRIEENKQVNGPLKPGSPAFQTNLDGLESVDRVLDAGHIMVYRLGFSINPPPDLLKLIELKKELIK